MAQIKQIPLKQQIKQALEEYFSFLEGETPANLYDMVIKEVEMPLIEHVLQYTDNNITKTAKILGITRNTLRKKMANCSKSV